MECEVRWYLDELHLPGLIQWMWLTTPECLHPIKLQFSDFVNFRNPSLAMASFLRWWFLCFSIIILSKRVRWISNEISQMTCQWVVYFTHISLVFESEVAAWPLTMEMSSMLLYKGTITTTAIFSGSISTEALLQDYSVFPVIVGVHLNIGRANIRLKREEKNYTWYFTTAICHEWPRRNEVFVWPVWSVIKSLAQIWAGRVNCTMSSAKQSVGGIPIC